MKTSNLALLAPVVFFFTGNALAAGNGLKGEYFNNTALLGDPVLVRTDDNVNFRWQDSGPGSGIAHNRFSVRWTGQAAASATGAFKFVTISNDGVRLWVNGAKVIDHWASHATARDESAPVNLVSGQKYDIKLEFYENSGAATARLLWDPPGSAEAIIPESALYSAPVEKAKEPVYLSSLDPTFSVNGLGPYQRNRSNGNGGPSDGRPISLEAVKFSRGLGVHAASELRYNLNGRYLTFNAFVGVDDEVAGKGTLIFEAWLDGVKVFSSGLMKGTDPNKPVKIDVTGKKELKLIVTDGGDGKDADHGDWADARLAVDPNPSSTKAPNPPTGVTAKPGDRQVVVSWNAVTGATGYKIFRATTSNGQGDMPVGNEVGTSYTNIGLTNGVQYFFKVAAVNPVGTSVKSNEVHATPNVSSGSIPAPTELKATPGDKQIILTWKAVTGAGSYNVYRGFSPNGQDANPIKSGLTTPEYTNTGLTNGTKYFYRIAALINGVVGEKSAEVSETPAAPMVPAGPVNLTATPGDKQVALAWSPLNGASSYNVYRGTASNGQATNPVMTGLTAPTFTNTGLNNGTMYYFKVAAVMNGATTQKSNEASAKPEAPPLPGIPTGLTATPGDKQIVLAWTAVTGATSYNIYRGTTSNGQAAAAVGTSATPSFTNTGLTNGTKYFYKVAAVNAVGTGNKSAEASATPTAPGMQLTQAQKDAFRFLRQSTFGPTPALVDHVVQVGKAAFIDEQLALPPTAYPDTLITMPNMELVSEQFFQNAVSGNDQLRQRVGWALSQIFVTSAVKVDNTAAMVPYIRMLQNNAFGNVKDLMRDVSLSPAMGEFLDMVNNKRAENPNSPMPNENYAREWLQLLSIGLQELNDDGTPQLNNGQPIPTFTQSTIADLARALTGWTYGDTAAGNPTRINSKFYGGPMEPVDRYHDVGQKTILGVNFPAGQTAQQDFDHALDVIFTHHNVGPFLVRQLIQRLVTSNPSPTYIRDVVAVFNNNGQGARGDLKAIVKAILLHPEAANGNKFAEPALFLTTLCRVICTNITDHPFLTDFSENMAQRIWFAPSVFNYFSPNYRVNNSFFAPEMQIWTTATAMTRTNFVASLITGGFGSNVTLNFAPFTAVAGDAQALVDNVNALIMGGTMSTQHKQAIMTALNSATSNNERVRTALYLTAASMQYQVEH